MSETLAELRAEVEKFKEDYITKRNPAVSESKLEKHVNNADEAARILTRIIKDFLTLEDKDRDNGFQLGKEIQAFVKSNSYQIKGVTQIFTKLDEALISTFDSQLLKTEAKFVNRKDNLPKHTKYMQEQKDQLRLRGKYQEEDAAKAKADEEMRAEEERKASIEEKNRKIQAPTEEDEKKKVKNQMNPAAKITTSVRPGMHDYEEATQTAKFYSTYTKKNKYHAARNIWVFNSAIDPTDLDRTVVYEEYTNDKNEKVFRIHVGKNFSGVIESQKLGDGTCSRGFSVTDGFCTPIGARAANAAKTEILFCNENPPISVGFYKYDDKNDKKEKKLRIPEEKQEAVAQMISDDLYGRKHTAELKDKPISYGDVHYKPTAKDVAKQGAGKMKVGAGIIAGKFSQMVGRGEDGGRSPG